jgi:hypothetical protein
MAYFEIDKLTYYRRDTRTFQVAKKRVDVVEFIPASPMKETRSMHHTISKSVEVFIVNSQQQKQPQTKLVFITPVENQGLMLVRL